jgi:hypothetical protein
LPEGGGGRGGQLGRRSPSTAGRCMSRGWGAGCGCPSESEWQSSSEYRLLNFFTLEVSLQRPKQRSERAPSTTTETTMMTGMLELFHTVVLLAVAEMSLQYTSSKQEINCDVITVNGKNVPCDREGGSNVALASL